jgi:hypothetical protein
MTRRAEDGRSRLEHVRQGTRVVTGIGPRLRDRDVAGRLGETAELPVGDRHPVDPEPVDGHPMNRRLLRVVPVGPHAERASRDKDHVPRYALARFEFGCEFRTIHGRLH